MVINKNLVIKLITGMQFCLLTTAGFAQSGKLPDPEAYFSAMIVKSIDSSVAWYSTILGFEVINRTSSDERGFKQVNLKRGNVLVELIELKTAVTPELLLKNQPGNTRIQGLFKFGFLVSEFDRWVEQLKQSGVQINGRVVTDNLSGKKTVIVFDPDGNRIQFFEK